MRLQDYDFSIEYRPGGKMAHVVYLSRNPVPARVLAIKGKYNDLTLQEHQNLDEMCTRLRNGDEHPLYVVKNNHVVTKDTLERYFVSISARLSVIALYHDKASHVGWEQGLQKMKEELHWTGMGQALKKYIRNCRSCVLHKSHTGKRSGTWQRDYVIKEKLDTWHVNHAGSMVRSKGHTQILVIIDAYTKYCM